MALTPKQLIFVKSYLVNKNATHAAIEAGYPAKSAYSVGCENLTKPEVRAAVQLGLAKQEADLDRKAALLGVTKERMIRELAKTAFADMNDYAQITERGGVKFTAAKDLKPGAARAIKKLSESSSLNGGSTSIELHSKDRAQELLCKMLGWTKNDLQLNLPSAGVQVILTMPANGSEAPKENATQEETHVDHSETEQRQT